MLKKLMKGFFSEKKRKEKKRHRKISKSAAQNSKINKKQYVDEDLLKTLERKGFKRCFQPVQPIQSIQSAQKIKPKKEKQKKLIVKLPKEEKPSLFKELFPIFNKKDASRKKGKKPQIIPILKEPAKEEIKQKEKAFFQLDKKKQIQKKGFFSRLSEKFKSEKNEELEPITILPPENNFRLIKDASSYKKDRDNQNESISQVLKQEIMPQKPMQEQEELKLQENKTNSSSMDILFGRKKRKQ